MSENNICPSCGYNPNNRPVAPVLSQVEKPFRQPPTNIEKITNFLEYGSSLNQAFVIEACSRYANELLADANETRRLMAGSFINPDVWLSCASNWKLRCEP